PTTYSSTLSLHDALPICNVTFEVRDVADLSVDEQFDVVFVFDAMHDQVDPVAVLDGIHQGLAPGGVFVMKEPHAADALEDNIDRSEEHTSELQSLRHLVC